jgi:NitT/TauT family transport system substrate-binding protein
MMRRLSLSIAALSVAAVALVGCAPPSSGGGETELESVTIATPSPSPLPWIGYYVADALGFYTEEGLDVEVVGSVPGDNSARALDNETVDYAGVSITVGLPVVASHEAGELVWVGFSDVWPFHISVLPDSDIASYKDLKGQKIAIRDDGDTGPVTTMLADGGLVEGDYELVRLGEGATLATGLVQGQVAAMFGSPFNEAFVAAQTGTEVRRLPSDNFDQFVNSGLMTHSENIDTAAKIARAVAKAWVWVEENPEDAIEMLAQAQPAAVTDKAGALDTLKVILSLNSPAIERHWAADADALAAQVEILDAEGDLDAAALIDEDALALAWAFDEDALRTAAKAGDREAAAGLND